MGEFRFVGPAILTAKAHQALERAVGQAAEDLVGKAQAVTPVDTGTLRASIHVEDGSGGIGEVSKRVATGGEANQYAVYVHEGTSRGVPAFKYLERPLTENANLYAEYVRRAVSGEF